MKRISTILLILLMLIPNLAFAEEQIELRTITKEYEFETTNYAFKYEPPSEITEDSIKYQYKSIEYEELSREDLFIDSEEIISKEVIEEKMRKQDDTAFDKIITIDDADYQGELELKEITYSESLLDGRSAEITEVYDYGYQSEKPSPPPTLDVLFKDNETGSDVLATLDFVRLNEKNPKLEDNIHVEQTYRSTYQDEYLLIDGTRLLFSDEKPTYQNYEDSILDQMRLDKAVFKIVDSKWLCDAETISDQTTRIAQYTVKRRVVHYSAVYSGKVKLPNILTYDGLAIYESIKINKEPNGRNYTVKAIVTYEETPIKAKKSVAPIVAGATGGVVGLCGLVFMLMKKRKKETVQSDY